MRRQLVGLEVGRRSVGIALDDPGFILEPIEGGAQLMQVVSSVNDPNQEMLRFALRTGMMCLVWRLYSGGAQESARDFSAEQDESHIGRL